LNRRAKAHELIREIVKRRLNLPPNTASVFRKKEISCHPAQYRANNHGRHCPRAVHRSSYRAAELQVMCHAGELPSGQLRRLILMRTISPPVVFRDDQLFGV
jgi:hypothetical protein